MMAIALDRATAVGDDALRSSARGGCETVPRQEMSTPQHHIIKETSDTLSRLLQDEFKRNGYKRVHIIDQAPKPDAVEGKLPAVSLYLYQLALDPYQEDGNV